MRAPDEMKSTPVSAIAATVSSVTPPEASSTARAGAIATASRSVAGGMLSRRIASAPAASASSSCVERIDLHLDLHQMAGKGLGAANRLADPAGDGDVVVLDQDRVVEAEAVVRAAAGAHGVFLQGAKARRGLARAGDPRLRAGDGVDIAARQRGDAGEMAEEVERHALGGKDRARVAGDARDDRAGGDARHRRRPALRTRIAGSICRNAASASASPQITPASRAAMTAAASAVAGIVAAEVMSPARPRSSASARSTAVSTSGGGSSEAPPEDTAS